MHEQYEPQEKELWIEYEPGARLDNDITRWEIDRSTQEMWRKVWSDVWRWGLFMVLFTGGILWFKWLMMKASIW